MWCILKFGIFIFPLHKIFRVSDWLLFSAYWALCVSWYESEYVKNDQMVCIVQNQRIQLVFQ